MNDYDKGAEYDEAVQRIAEEFYESDAKVCEFFYDKADEDDVFDLALHAFLRTRKTGGPAGSRFDAMLAKLDLAFGYWCDDEAVAELERRREAAELERADFMYDAMREDRAFRR